MKHRKVCAGKLEIGRENALPSPLFLLPLFSLPSFPAGDVGGRKRAKKTRKQAAGVFFFFLPSSSLLGRVVLNGRCEMVGREEMSYEDSLSPPLPPPFSFFPISQIRSRLHRGAAFVDGHTEM